MNITVYKIKANGVFGGDVDLDVEDADRSPIPAGHTRASPHPIPSGHYAVMNGGWKYVQGEAPIEDFAEQLAADARKERDRRIAETDWMVVKHLELNENVPGKWEVYRQALRDVPQQPGFPNEITWPVKPE